MTDNTIQSSNNYSQFKRLLGNRQIKKAHVNKLAEALAENTEAIKYNPILVNEKMEIVDGQHRFEALERLGLPVYYIQHTGLTIDDAHKLNSLVKSWTPRDYAQAYSTNGNSNYTAYLEMLNAFPFGHHTIVAYLAAPKTYPRTEAFRAGNFRAGSTNEATKLLDTLVEVSAFYDGYRRRGFSMAYLTALRTPNFNHKVFLGKLNTKYGQKTMKPVDTVGENLRQIEAIYNHYLPEEKQIYFNTTQVN